MVVYNNAPGEIEANVPGMSVPTVKLSSEDGEKLVSQLKAGGTKRHSIYPSLNRSLNKWQTFRHAARLWTRG